MSNSINPQNGKIEYRVVENELHYSYYEQVLLSENSSKIYTVEGVVPIEIFEKGKAAIQQYVESVVDDEISRQLSEHQAQQDFADKPDFEVNAVFDDVLLSGQIVRSSHRFIEVELLSPYKGKKHINYGFASALAGCYVFDAEGNFSESTIKSAKALLISIYKELKHRADYPELYQLSDSLNNRNS